jgi:exopolyphosphatase/guanosine-5'-triphosphate,3'-diphosphate pyrophosphatase
VLFAAVDLGTNTFHVLLARVENDKIVEVFRKRKFVYLLQKDKSVISKLSRNRAYKAVLYIREIFNKYNVESVYITGTEAFRSAKNGSKLKSDLQKIFRYEINIISGSEEARLTFIGVSHSLRPVATPYTIIDIGGGSIEFINVNEKGSLEISDSLPIGISVIAAKCNYIDKLNDKELSLIEQEFSSYTAVLGKYRNKHIIFNAGSFEVLNRLGFSSSFNSYCTYISIKPLLEVCQSLIESDLNTRKKMEWLPATREKNMHFCSIIIKLIIKYLAAELVVYSPYSIKEGIILSLSKK